jgi:hypothetical protein
MLASAHANRSLHQGRPDGDCRRLALACGQPYVFPRQVLAQPQSPQKVIIVGSNGIELPVLTPGADGNAALPVSTVVK